jgi:uncharacterized phosphosugar-binding protein
MSKALNDFHSRVKGLLDEIMEVNQESFKAASAAMIQRIVNDRLIYVYGTGGHSIIAAEESFYRAGGLVQISPVLDAGFSMLNGGLFTASMGRTVNHAKMVLKRYNLGPEDVLILVNAYGVNCATIDAALTAKEKGTTVIGITSPAHALQLTADHPARHPSHKNLHEIADIVIDSRMPFGDAVLEIEGVPDKVSAVSTLCSVFIIEGLFAQVAEDMVAQGLKPEIWISGNVPNGDETNRANIEKYRQRVRYF